MADYDDLEARRAAHANAYLAECAARRARAEREQAQRDDIIRGAVLEVTAALQHVESIRDSKHTGITYETMQRSGFKRKNWQRPYALPDARSEATTAALRLRNAWELLDPINPAKQAEAQRTALANAQEALQTAVRHMQAMLRKARTANEQLAADAAARDWLASIGSEPN